jgi:hypothetical protein
LRDTQETSIGSWCLAAARHARRGETIFFREFDAVDENALVYAGRDLAACFVTIGSVAGNRSRFARIDRIPTR